jgi:nanoRNase/pAp phosphatase (c-di-AMP/oligoRNAs hydrolase)
VRPDPDAYGSQCGLTEILREVAHDDKSIFIGFVIHLIEGI